MLNEFEEFRAYTEGPVYINEGKSDLSFLGRFTLEMLLDFKGFQSRSISPLIVKLRSQHARTSA